MRNAWCSLDPPAAQSGAMGSRVGRPFMPSPKSRWAGSSGMSVPATSSSSSTIPFAQSMTSMSSSRDDVRPARSSSERDSSPSSSGQAQSWTLTPGPRWRQELSDVCGDTEASSSAASQPGLHSQGQPMRPQQDRASRGGRGGGRGAASGDPSEGYRRRKGLPQSKKLRSAAAAPPGSRERAYSSSSDSSGSSHRSARGDLRRLSADWRDDEDFRAAVQLNRTIAATSNAEDVLRLVEEHGHVFTSVNAATAFHRLAKCGQETSLAQQESLRLDPRTKQLAELVEAKWEDWGGRAANNIAWGHAVLGHGSSTIMSKVDTKLLEKLPTMSAHEMCLILWSFAKTGFTSPQGFEKAVPYLLARKHEMNIQTITMLTWAYATAAPYNKALFATCCEVVLNDWHSIDLRALSNMTWACARVEHYDEKLFDAIAARVATSWEHIFNWDLGNYAWGLGKAYGELGIQGSALADEDRERAISRYLSDNPVRNKALEAISAAALRQMGVLNMRTISNIAYGCACVHFWDCQLMDALAQRAIDLAGQGNGQSLAILLWAFSTLRHEHPALMEALAKRGLQLLDTPVEEGGLNNTAMTMVFWAYANLGNNTDTSRELLLQLAEEACARQDTYSSLPAVAWSLTVAGCLPDPLLRKIRNLVGDLRGMDELNLSQLYQTELAVRLRDAASPAQAPARAEDLFRECYQMGEVRAKTSKFWESQLAHGKRYITAIHIEVARTVESLGGNIKLEHDTGEWSVDIGFPEHHVAIEVDGPTHFASNTRRPLGPTLLKRRLLAARGWEVVSVPYFHWAELNTEFERQLYIHLALQAQPRGRHVVAAPVAPQRMDDAGAFSLRRKVEGMLQDVSAPFPAANWTAPIPSAQEQPGSPASSAASMLTPSGSSGSRYSVPADMTACTTASEEQERPCGEASSSREASRDADSQREALGSKGTRLAVLQYKQGRLSRHGLLTKVARRAANGHSSNGPGEEAPVLASQQNDAEE